ncbi:carboxypeptidase-like regulatory domain-containing protein [Flavobacterium sp. GT3R68]|uniref:carboxypeptidase-like regulatory domain-containing protein n=1 Tax=Flavobacterium sp. GT3R68 TaxID=2594437 RepID=UPI000F88ED8C|nr:carboxypeptidase-like regulatory domain-containing protein [Flavobacterium sp. GT3R68]RTY94000.1 carboxypeptidase-like regulatory domain-containing protein [Flavobacterium sp. GSN2]TRW93387.1 carboxypeptidase-like regulatory domain-containing protein [Flavobacterium sp. GT3R68]
MRNIIILLFISHLSWSQNQFSGIVRDSETMELLPFVNIVFDDSGQSQTTGSITNENGEFTLHGTFHKVVFSHINYEPLHVNLQEKSNEIFLKPKNYILDEIVVSKTSAKKYLKKILKSSTAKIQKNTQLKSYCREIVKVNNNYTKFSDALVDYYIKRGNGKSNIQLTQHRALKNKEHNSLSKGNVDNMNSGFNVKDYVKNAYDFDGLGRLLKSKEYDFIRKLKKEANGDEYEYIHIIPHIASKSMLNEGYVIIDPKTKSILEFKIYSAESHLNNSKLVNILIAKVQVKNVLNWTKFRYVNNQYILVYNRKQVDFFVKMGNKLDDDFSFMSDLFVFEFKNNAPMPAEGYNKTTIFEAGTNFKEEYWKKYNSFPLSGPEEKFINSIQ